MKNKVYERKLEQFAERRLKMKMLFANGMSLTQIGKRYRISKQRVSQILKIS